MYTENEQEEAEENVGIFQKPIVGKLHIFLFLY